LKDNSKVKAKIKR